MRILFLSLSFLYSYNARTQGMQNPSGNIHLHALLSYDFPTSYGASATIDLPLKTFFKHNKAWYDHKQNFLSIGAGAIRYPFNSTSLKAQAGIGIRKYINDHYYREWIFTSGIMRTFYDGLVYEVTSNGNVKEKPLYGRFYATSGISYSLNWVTVDSNKPVFGFQIKPTYWIQYPFNSFFKMHLSVEFGISYHLIKNRP